MSSDEEDGGVSLSELFCAEAQAQARVLGDGLLRLEREEPGAAAIEPLMRAAHSLKGAARVLDMSDIEQLAHVMEDCFLAASRGSMRLERGRVDRLLAAVDLIAEMAAAGASQVGAWLARNQGRIADATLALHELAHAADTVQAPPSPAPPSTANPPAPPAVSAAADSALRIDARALDRLLALAGEARVAGNALGPQKAALQRLRQRQHEAFTLLDHLQLSVRTNAAAELKNLRERMAPLEQMLAERVAELEAFERRLQGLASGLLDEVLALRMRPFRDATQGLARMVRDLAHTLGKEARLEIAGGDTPVDRDVLTGIEAPLQQALRNAVDHGIELPAQRHAAGKPQAGSVRLEARHRGGMLEVVVSDDGQGLDPERIREVVVQRGLCALPMAEAMSEAELYDFLLLPGFSLKESAGTISGRGVGLDVVADAVRRLDGRLRLASTPGRGFMLHIVLPLSRSLMRALVFRVAGQPFALPLAHVLRVARVPRAQVHTLAEREFFTLAGQHIDLIAAAPLLEIGAAAAQEHALAVLVIGQGGRKFGLVVDAIDGEESVAVQPLDGLFGKLRDVAGAAVLENGTPALVLDHADLIHSIERLAQAGGLRNVPGPAVQRPALARRILVVDDSLTVREMERRLLQSRGYQVEVAVDGMDGWNAVRSGDFDLVITDVDMPRLDGIELVSRIKKDERLRNLPVMIVSYKDRAEDRMRGVEAGADYYLAKGSFHDETLLDAVADLIGDSAE